jgi:plastocyanin
MMHVSWSRLAPTCLASLLLLACGTETDTDTAKDAVSSDAAASDSSSADGATADGTAAVDAGSDTASSDLGGSDAGQTDAGGGDVATADETATDAAAADVAATDVAAPDVATADIGTVDAGQSKNWTVKTSGFTFDPPELTIAVGDTVTFTPNAGHTATQVEKATWDADGNSPMAGGLFNVSGPDSKAVTFDKAGDVWFVCKPHASMKMKGHILVK